MATVESPTGGSSTAGDSGELAGFGYKQELDRSLGNFSSFAAGFSYISILTGVIQLFAFGFLFAGPAVWWTWPIVLFGQMMVALCFSEMAQRSPAIEAVASTLKTLVREDAQGKVWIGCNRPEYLQQRHGVPADLLQNIAVVQGLVSAAAK